MTEYENAVLAELAKHSQELKMIRIEMIKVLNHMTEAENEIPESMRRFTMYMTDLHTVKHFYEEHGLQVPQYVLRECERVDDRLRQLLDRQHTDGGTFEKVRREMASDPLN